MIDILTPMIKITSCDFLHVSKTGLPVSHCWSQCQQPGRGWGTGDISIYSHRAATHNKPRWLTAETIITHCYRLNLFSWRKQLLQLDIFIFLLFQCNLFWKLLLSNSVYAVIIVSKYITKFFHSILRHQWFIAFLQRHSLSIFRDFYSFSIIPMLPVSWDHVNYNKLFSCVWCPHLCTHVYIHVCVKECGGLKSMSGAFLKWSFKLWRWVSSLNLRQSS